MDDDQSTTMLPRKPAPDLPMIEPARHHLHLIAANGMRHAVLLAGDDAAPPVLLIHGLGWDHGLWNGLVDPLVEDGYRVIKPDLRGMGQSDKPDEAYSIDLYRRDLAGILDALGLEGVSVVGFSLGGMIAAALACRDRRVARMVLACCTLHSEPQAERATEAMLAQAERDGPLAFAKAQAEAIWAPAWAAAHKDAVADFIRCRTAMDQPALHRAFRSSYGVDLRPACRALHVPALVLASDNDPFVSLSSAQAVATAIPGAAFEHFEAGHMLPLEQPTLFEAAVLEFLRHR